MKNVSMVKALICFALIAVSVAILFVPVVEGAEEVKSMFILLTGIAVRDFFGSAQEDKRVEELRQAYDPSPPTSYVEGEER